MSICYKNERPGEVTSRPGDIPAYDERGTWGINKQVLFGLSGRSVDILEFSRSKFHRRQFGLFSFDDGRSKIEVQVEQSEVEYLGHMITRRIRPSPSEYVVAKRNTQLEINNERRSERNHSQFEVITCNGSMHFERGGRM